MSIGDNGASRDELSLLLERIDDPRLRADIAAHVSLLRRSRRFGLVFDRHLPEAARLPKMKPRAGDRVARRDEADATTWRVLGFTDRTRNTARLQPLTWAGHQWAPDGEPLELPATDVVVVRDHGEPIHPGLQPYDLIQAGEPGTPTHIALEGENLHALQLLKATHGPEAGDGRHGLVDLIYIDPPYNTGNKSWIYNDRYVDAQDQSKSSKWLSFMERRLRAAKPLLRETGVVIVAIGDDEHHRLRMLMDQIFGTDNFISDVVWQGGRKNDSRFVSNGADYMLVYAREKSLWAVTGIKPKDSPTLSDLTSAEVTEKGARWWEGKPGAREALAAAEEIWAASDSHAEAQRRYRKWMRSFKKTGIPTDAVSRYTTLDASGEPIRTDGNISWPGGGGPTYDVLHPVTGKPCAVPSRGWMFSDPASMQAEIDAGNIYFGKDHTTQPGGITRLSSLEEQVAESVFDYDRNNGATHLYFERTGSGVFTEKRFPNPKDHTVLARWINLAAPRDAVVLDFFGGSGSTMEAVLRLNAEDGGTRQCILVTNNELAHKDAAALRKAGHHPGDEQFEAKGVFRHVAHPRIKTVVTGIREDGSVYDETGLAANVAFYSLTQLDPGQVRRGREFTAIAPILWMQAGGVGPVIDREGDDFTLTDTYGVLFDTGHRRAFTQAVNERQPGTAFIVTDSSATFRDVAAGLPASVQSLQLYESYLNNFEVNTTRLEA